MDQIEQTVRELREGKGYVLLDSLFSDVQIHEAERLVRNFSQIEHKATHFHGGHKEKIYLQRRVWNLLNKGQVFCDMVEHPVLMEIFSQLLGKRFILGSFAANRLLPGAPGQEPHVDYPYWDIHDREEFPLNINGSFLMNCQTLIMLHDFTEENGGTAVVPGSQRYCRYPTQQEFDQSKIQLIAPKGTTIVFNGLMWHRSMPNKSNAERTSLLGQYLPKFVKPMEDLVQSVAPNIVKAASPTLRQLIGIDLRYPERMDDAIPDNSQGRYGD